jgi:hypothetical protein
MPRETQPSWHGGIVWRPGGCVFVVVDDNGGPCTAMDCAGKGLRVHPAYTTHSTGMRVRSPQMARLPTQLPTNVYGCLNGPREARFGGSGGSEGLGFEVWAALGAQICLPYPEASPEPSGPLGTQLAAPAPRPLARSPAPLRSLVLRPPRGPRFAGPFRGGCATEGVLTRDQGFKGSLHRPYGAVRARRKPRVPLRCPGPT